MPNLHIDLSEEEISVYTVKRGLFILHLRKDRVNVFDIILEGFIWRLPTN